MKRKYNNYNRQKGLCSKDNAFERIDNELSAYFLGYLLADGCICEADGKIFLQLKCHERDKDILEKFKEFVGSKANICVTSVRGKKDYVVMRISCRKICYDLMKFGIVPRKTFVAAPIELNGELERHFWRGVVDGDGWVGVSLMRSNGRYYEGMGLCGTEDVCNGLRLFAIKNGILTNVVVCEAGERSYKFNIQCRQARLLAKLLYSNCAVYLDRKYNIVVGWKNE